VRPHSWIEYNFDVAKTSSRTIISAFKRMFYTYLAAIWYSFKQFWKLKLFCESHTCFINIIQCKLWKLTTHEIFYFICDVAVNYYCSLFLYFSNYKPTVSIWKSREVQPWNTQVGTHSRRTQLSGPVPTADWTDW